MWLALLSCRPERLRFHCPGWWPEDLGAVPVQSVTGFRYRFGPFGFQAGHGEFFQPRPCRVCPRIGRGRGHNPFSLRDIDLLRRMPPPDGIGSLAATAPVRSARCGETDAGEFRLDLIEKGERPPPSFPSNRPQRHLPWAWLRPPASAASAPSCRCRPVPCRSSSPSCTGPASLCRNRSSRRRIFRHLRRRYSCKAHHQPGQRLQRVQPIQGRPTPRQDRPKAVRPQRSDRPRPR